MLIFINHTILKVLGLGPIYPQIGNKKNYQMIMQLKIQINQIKNNNPIIMIQILIIQIIKEQMHIIKMNYKIMLITHLKIYTK